MTSDGFGEARPLGGAAQPSPGQQPGAQVPLDPFTTAPPASDAGKPAPQPAAIYHPPPPPGTVPAFDVPPAPPPSFRPGVSTDRNWMAIVSLVLGLLGGGWLGIGFGIAALRAANQGRATNRTMAIWGIVLNSTMWIVYLLGFIALTAAMDAVDPYDGGALDNDPVLGAGDPDLIPVTEIPLGTCFLEPELEGGYYYGVEAISCDEPHYAQVYATGQLAEQAYVSEENMAEVAWDLCFTDEAVAAIHPAVAPDLYADVYYPGTASWNAGDRGYVCFAWDERGPLSNSVLAADLEISDANRP